MSILNATCLLGFFLASANAPASPLPAGAEAYRESDLIHDEYRQDLALALSRSQALIGQSARGEERAAALLFQARVQRLRGEYRSALESLAAAETETPGDLLLRVRTLAERRWTEIDQYTTPWGTFKPGATDLLCLRPDFLMAGQRYLREKVDATRALRLATSPPDLAQRLENESDYLSEWVQRAEQGGIQREILSHSVTDAQLRDQARMLLEFYVNAAEDTIHLGEQLGALSPERAMGLRLRLEGPVLAGQEEGIRKLIHCPIISRRTHPDALLRGQAALTCAELRLFPDGTPDNLGHIVDEPAENETLFSSASDQWDGINRIKSWRSRQGRDAGDLLAQAEQAFAEARSERGLARVQYIRAADLLSGEVVEGVRKAGELAKGKMVRLPELLIGASAKAKRAGDLRLHLRALALLSLYHALGSSRERAEETLGPVLDHVRDQGDHGLGLGLARLFTAAAAIQGLVHHDLYSAELMNELAAALYQGARAPIEHGHLIRRQAEVFIASGSLARAELVLERELTDLERTGCKAAPLLSRDTSWVPRDLVALRSYLVSDLVNLHIRRLDAKALSKDLDRDQQLLDLIAAGRKEPFAQLKQEADERLRVAEALFQETKRQLLSGKLARTERPQLQTRMDQAFGDGIAARERAFGYLIGIGIVESLRDWRLLLAQLKDREALVKDPDRPKERWYEETARQAEQNPGRLRRLFLAQVAGRRRGVAAAIAQWPAQPCDPKLATGNQRGQALQSRMAELLKREEIEGVLNEARARIAFGDYPGAEQTLCRLEGRLGERGPAWAFKTQEPWRHLQLYVEVLSGLGQHDQALALAHQMVDQAEKRRGGLFDERLQIAFTDNRDANSIYSTAVAAAARAGRAGDALMFIEMGKARALQEGILMEQQEKLRSLQPLAEKLNLLDWLQVENDCAQRTDEKRCQELQSDWQDTWEKYQHAHSRLPTSTQVLLGPLAKRSDESTMRDLRGKLPQDAVLLDFYQTDDLLVGVVLAPGQEPAVWYVSADRPIIKGQVYRIVEEDAADLEPTKEDGRRRLSQLLLGSSVVQQALSRSSVRELIIVPHGVLHELPLADLPFQNGYLIERFVLRVLPYAGLLLRTETSPSPARRTAAVMAYRGDSDSGSPLQKAEAEAAAVANVYGTQPDVAATRGKVLDALHGGHILHLIAHGLSKRDKRPAYLDLKEQDLSVADLLSDPVRSPARLVVLSACQLGKGRASAGDEGIGIPRALLQNGVGAVLGALWNLDDDDTFARMMVDFHGLYQASGDAAQALAKVQRQAIMNRVPASKWAGLILLGGR